MKKLLKEEDILNYRKKVKHVYALGGEVEWAIQAGHITDIKIPDGQNIVEHSIFCLAMVHGWHADKNGDIRLSTCTEKEIDLLIAYLDHIKSNG